MHCYILEDHCTEHPKVSSIQISVIQILSFSVFYPSNLVVRYPQLLHCWAASFRIPVTFTVTVTAPSEVPTRRNGTRWEARSGTADQNRAWHKTTMQQQTMGQPRFQGQEVNTVGRPLNNNHVFLTGHLITGPLFRPPFHHLTTIFK